MLLSIRRVVADEVCVTVWDLVVEFVGPRVSKHGECLVCKATENADLILDFALDEGYYVRFVAHCFNKLSKLSWILVLVGLVLKDQVPLATHHLREVINLVVGELFEHLRELRFLLLVQDVRLKEEVVAGGTRVGGLRISINGLEVCALSRLKACFINHANGDRDLLFCLEDGHYNLVDEFDIASL